MRHDRKIFVDSGAWIALAVVHDVYHDRARETWDSLAESPGSLFTSVPILLETFTYLDRKGSRDLAVRWRESLRDVARLQVLGCSREDLGRAWAHMDNRKLHKLSLVDATSFVLMDKQRIRTVFTFDAHFATAGYRVL